jgi:hypothetical protein
MVAVSGAVQRQAKDTLERESRASGVAGPGGVARPLAQTHLVATSNMGLRLRAISGRVAVTPVLVGLGVVAGREFEATVGNRIVLWLEVLLGTQTVDGNPRLDGNIQMEAQWQSIPKEELQETDLFVTLKSDLDYWIEYAGALPIRARFGVSVGLITRTGDGTLSLYSGIEQLAPNPAFPDDPEADPYLTDTPLNVVEFAQFPFAAIMPAAFDQPPAALL